MTLWCMTNAMVVQLPPAAGCKGICVMCSSGLRSGQPCSIHLNRLSHSTDHSVSCKSAVMVFRRRHREKRPAEHVHLGKAEVQLCEVTRHLGVTVTKSLTWSAHIDNILNHVNCKTFVLKRLAWKCPDSTFVRHLFLCLVRPVLEYAGPVWDSCSKADCLRLRRLQVSVARSILRLGRRSSSSSDILKQIGWPTLAWRRRRYKLLFLWKMDMGLRLF